VSVGVGVGCEGVLVGVFVLVSVTSRINVGVGVKVFVGGRIVGEGCGVDANSAGDRVKVSFGSELATDGGKINPARSNAVPANPMKRPMDRYLISARMVGFRNFYVSQ
jgi:hypothetical protein